MTIKEELEIGLRELRKEINPPVVILTYGSGSSAIVGYVQAIVFNADIDMSTPVMPLLTSKLICNILKQDLIDKGLPVKGFTSVQWNRVTYGATQRPMSSWDTVIVLELKAIG